MSKKDADIEIEPSVIVRVMLHSRAGITYRFIDQFAHEPYASDVGGLTPGDLQIAGKTTETTAIVATFPKGEWAGFEVEGDSLMMADE